jgi:hypothetical protein
LGRCLTNALCLSETSKFASVSPVKWIDYSDAKCPVIENVLPGYYLSAKKNQTVQLVLNFDSRDLVLLPRAECYIQEGRFA